VDDADIRALAGRLQNGRPPDQAIGGSAGGHWQIWQDCNGGKEYTDRGMLAHRRDVEAPLRLRLGQPGRGAIPTRGRTGRFQRLVEEELRKS
jgi:hypothetical protein